MQETNTFSSFRLFFDSSFVDNDRTMFMSKPVELFESIFKTFVIIKFVLKTTG